MLFRGSFIYDVLPGFIAARIYFIEALREPTPAPPPAAGAFVKWLFIILMDACCVRKNLSNVKNKSRGLA